MVLIDLMKKLLLLLFVIVYPLHSSEVLYCSEKESTGFGTKNNEPYTTSSFELTRFTMELSVGEFDSKLTKNPADLMKVADQPLYKAKHEGRNRTIVGTP